MNWITETAKNGIQTLKYKEQYVYSKYNPIDDAFRFISQNFDNQAYEYVLLGLGLGYHLKELVKLAQEKDIYVILIDTEELEVFNSYSPNKELLNLDNVYLIENKGSLEVNFNSNAQVLIPYTMLNILPTDHYLKSLLENIKLNQMSYEFLQDKMLFNFKKNLHLNDANWGNLENIFFGETACLVSSGPSIDEIIPYLKKWKDKCFVLCVGSALRILLNNNIVPHAVIISDPKHWVYNQFANLEYNGLLFYLATASNEAVVQHKGKRICLLQKGYLNSEKEASKLKIKTIEVGGSVATVGLSLLEYLGFKNVILCGQDLGFTKGKTHSVSSTSGIYINQQLKYKKVKANN
ncbi:DUF115 domain-containing protein, partial [Butyricicoccus sp. 1XD8-22]